MKPVAKQTLCTFGAKIFGISDVARVWNRRFNTKHSKICKETQWEKNDTLMFEKKKLAFGAFNNFVNEEKRRDEQKTRLIDNYPLNN
jgi:hypothetical protein